MMRELRQMLADCEQYLKDSGRRPAHRAQAYGTEAVVNLLIRERKENRRSQKRYAVAQHFSSNWQNVAQTNVRDRPQSLFLMLTPAIRGSRRLSRLTNGRGR